MRIATRDIPQADDLDVLLAAVEAVKRGAKTYQEIAVQLGKVERQGRYYRRAADLLGLISVPSTNQSQVTSLGNKLLSSNDQERRLILSQSVLGTALFQRVAPFLESKQARGASRNELAEFVEGVTAKTTASMIERRVSTVLAWLRYLGMLDEVGNRHRVICGPLTGPIEYLDNAEPLLPRRFDLVEYHEIARRHSMAQESIQISLNAVSRERSSDAHNRLTNLVAKRIREAGAIPRRNKFVDLAAVVSAQSYLFEVKSTTESNIQSQVRAGVSQLYEYQYLQDAPDAHLVLVLEGPLPRRLQWMGDYLLLSRGIFYVWDSDADSLHCPPSIRERLEFLCA